MDSPRPAIASSAVIARAAMDTPSSSPVIFSSVPRLMTETFSSRSICLMFSSNAPEYCHQQFGLFNLHYLFYDYTLLCLISN